MIKLIATDIDGTLVKESSSALTPELLKTVEALVEKGVFFCAASGRQYHSIYRMFHTVADKITYIAENGAHICMGNKDLQVTAMERRYVEEIVRKLRQYGDACEVVVSTAMGSVFESKNKAFSDMIQYQYHNKFMQVEDILAIDMPVRKIAVYCKEGVGDLRENILLPQWKDKVKACTSGEEWVDIMDASVDKGNALAYIREYFGIAKEETMAFGDNENDIGMMQEAGESYAVDNAVEKVKQAAMHVCPDYTKQGVCQVLQKVLQTMG